MAWACYPDWKTTCCDTYVAAPPPSQEVIEAYDRWEAQVESDYRAHLERRDTLQKAGIGDWGNFEMFQLHPNDPLRDVNSMAEYRAACKARAIDPDTHKPTKENRKFYSHLDRNPW